MLNTHKFFLIIAGLTFFNIELVHAGGNFSKGFPSKQQQDNDDEEAKKQEAELAAQRARQLAAQRARQLAAQRARQAELEEQKARQEADEAERPLSNLSSSEDIETIKAGFHEKAIKDAEFALPFALNLHAQRPPQKEIEELSKALRMQSYVQQSMRFYLLLKKPQSGDPKLTPAEEKKAELCGMTAFNLVLDNQNPHNLSLWKIQLEMRKIIEEDSQQNKN
jgi:hypothetical protein